MAKEKRKKVNFKKKYFLPALIILIAVFALIIISETADEDGIGYNTELQPESSLPLAKEEIQPAIPILTEPKGLGDYYTATFSDSFSGQAWLDGDQTTLYHDWTSTNFLFPPVIDTEEIIGPDFLDNFIPEKISAGQNFVLFLGRHRLSQQRNALVWSPAENVWSKFDVSAYWPANRKFIEAVEVEKNIWLVFSREEQTLNAHFLEFLAGPESGEIKIYSSGTPLNIGVAKEPQVVCCLESCLISSWRPIGFWEFLIRDRSFRELAKLKKTFNQKAPDNIFALPMDGSVLEAQWLIAWSKKIGEKNYQFGVEKADSRGHASSLVSGLTAEYSGRPAMLALGDDKIFLFWASYFTHAYEVNLNGQTKDLTDSFGWRISADKPFHLYKFPHSLYIKNEARSVIRWNGQINTRIDPDFWLSFNPYFLEIIPRQNFASQNLSGQVWPEKVDGGYLIAGVPAGGTKIYQFQDFGFDLSKSRQISSAKVNFSVDQIQAAQISQLKGVCQEEIKTELSNDGGVSWQEAEIGQTIHFETHGNDLRWKAVFTPIQAGLSADGEGTNYITPYIRSVHLQYWYEK